MIKEPAWDAGTGAAGAVEHTGERGIRGDGGRVRIAHPIMSAEACHPVPAHEGSVAMELGASPVPYHIDATAEGLLAEDEYHALAVSSCRLACLAADVARGRVVPAALRRAVAAPCLRKLERLAFLLKARTVTDEAADRAFRRMPVVPGGVRGMVVSERAFESCVVLSIGAERYWVNLRLEVVGSRWVCVLADIG